MKSYISALLSILIVSLFISACSSKKGKELNDIPKQDFYQFIIKEIQKSIKKKAKEGVNVPATVHKYLDSLVQLPGLDKMHKSQVELLQARQYLAVRQYDTASIKCKSLIKSNKDKVNAVLISAYYMLGEIQEQNKKIYQAHYYKNKAGELLKKYDIYHTFPEKADVMLSQIAFSNKYFNQIGIANSFADAAIEKYDKYNKNDKTGGYPYVVKAFMFSARENLNKDSIDFYINKIIEISKDKIYEINKQNINYINAEYYYNTHQVDSALFYMKQISPELNSGALNDELNLLTIYSRLKEYKKADKQLQLLNKKKEQGKFNAADSLLYFNNLVDYYLNKKDYKKAINAGDHFLDFHAHFYSNETQKNISELSSVIDLQQKNEEILVIKNDYEKEVQRRNLSITISILLLIIALFTIAYIKIRSDKRRLEIENKSTNLKLKLLQTQINPHFIFNTLGSIRSLIRQDEKDMSIKYLSSFSMLLRQILDLSRNTEITLDKEITLLKAYVEMQKLRKNNFDIQINIDKEIEEIQEDIPLPALTLQPFVENSIIHGFKDINYKGKIIINIEDKIEYLDISIADNGCGLKNDSKERKRKSHGIDIIKENLTIIGKSTGKPASLEISNQTNKLGTIVKLKIPV